MSPDAVYAFLERYVPKSKNPHTALLLKKQKYDVLHGNSLPAENKHYVDIVSDMKILKELLDALGLKITDDSEHDERDIRSEKLAKVFKKHDTRLREYLDQARRNPREGFSVEATATMKLLPRLLRSCGLCHGNCGDTSHFIRRKDTTVQGKRVKYRVYGIPRSRIPVMDELSRYEPRPRKRQRILDTINTYGPLSKCSYPTWS